MNRGLEAKTLIDSERWRQFLESTASALQMSLIFLIPESKKFLSVCEKCPVCGKALPPFNTAMLTDSAEADGLNAAFDDMSFLNIFYLQERYAVIARNHPCGHADNGITLHDKVNAAKELLGSYLVVLTDQWSKEQHASEITALRQINHIVLSMLRGEDNALGHVLDLILSAAVILMDAGGGWFAYSVNGEKFFITKGCGSSPADGTDINGKDVSITKEFKSQAFQGTLCIINPEEADSVDTLLNFMMQECVIVFEIDSLIRNMESKMSLILGSIDNLILLIDKRQYICYANRAASAYLRTPIPALIGMSIREMDTPWRDCLLAGTTKVVKGLKDKLQNKNETLIVNWDVYPLTGGEDIPGWIVIAYDCTDLYRLGEIGAKMERLVTTSNLLNVLAHEIRNPLATFKGLLQLLNIKSRTPETGKYIDIGLKEIQRLTLLLDNFMLLGKTTSSNMEPVNLQAFLEDVMILLKMEYSDDQFELASFLSAVPPVLIDKQQMTQVIINLVKNASEAINKNGRISIHLKQVNNAYAEIRISDTGPGIPDYVKDKLFQPYYSTKPNGTGLGLAIVHTIIQNHEGSISVSNNPEGGASFIIQLPIGTGKNRNSNRTDILLVIDDDMTRIPMERVLKAGEINTVTISRQDNLFTAIDKCKPSVIFIDNHYLNDRILNNLLHNIRADYPEVLLLIGGENPNIDTDEYIRFITKPINYAQLVHQIFTFMDNSLI